MNNQFTFSSVITLIDQGIKKAVFPGASFEIGNRSGPLKRYWAGNRMVYPEVRPLCEQTLFDLASLTKIIVTTMLILRFMEKGILCLSDTINDYYDAPDDKKAITIQQLLTHTSGIRPYTSIVNQSSPECAEEIILSLPLAYPPGSEVGYSCLGYILLGKILEKVSNQPLNKLANQEVFIPLGMKNTGYGPCHDNIAATDYNRDNGFCRIGIVNDHNARYLGGVAGNAGVFSDLIDVAQFARMLANRGKINGTQYLSEAVFQKAINNYTPNFHEHRGLGFILSDSPNNSYAELLSLGSFGHTGYTGTSIAVDINSGLYAVLLTSRLHRDHFSDQILRFRKCFHNAVIAEYEHACT